MTAAETVCGEHWEAKPPNGGHAQRVMCYRPAAHGGDHMGKPLATFYWPPVAP
jgi:hypothetical protein